MSSLTAGVYMKLINIFLLSFFLSGNLSAQWFWQNPLPQGNHLKDLQIVSSNIGYAIGEEGTLLKTESAGEDWQILTFPSKFNLEGLSFINENDGWIVGQKNNEVNLFKTSDGGINWEVVLNKTGVYSSIYFLNENIGRLCIDSSIYATSNAGNNWQLSNLKESIQKIYFSSADYGWALGFKGVFRTTDGGNTWIYSFLGANSPLIYMWEFHIVNNQIGWIIANDFYQFSSGGYVFKTTDGGVNWTEEYFGIHVVDIEFYDEHYGWILTGSKTYFTTDGGNNWEEKGNIVYGINVIKSVSNSILLGVGRGGYIIISSNSGSTWIHRSLGIRTNLHYASFINDYYSFIAGDDIILKTTNGGQIWEGIEVPFNITEESVSIHFLDSLTGMISNSNKIWRTTNGGNTWVNVFNSPYSLYELNFIDINVGWVGSNSGDIYRTFDSGLTWSIVGDVDIQVYTVEFVNQNIGWCGGYIGFFKTTNGGLNWTSVTLPVNMVPTDIFFINSDVGWVVGYGDGAVLKTTNGGITWEIKYTFPSLGAHVPRKLFFVDSLQGWVSTGDYSLGNIIHTTDGGEHWEPINLPTSNIINDFWFTNKDKGWVVGEYGTILHTTNGGVTFIEDGINSFQLKEYLLNQNYPNPFNPSTKISWQSPVGSWQTLKVYDMLGREVATLVNEYKPAGSYEVEFTGDNLSSGIYFYQLQADDYVETKKMILLR